jgi:nucleoside-diphosphate-sugar epimerase
LNKEKNPYTASKLYGEELCKSYKDSFGIDYLIIRPSTVYGPQWDETRRLMHIFIVNALENRDLVIYGDPDTKTLDFTYVSDFIDGVLLAMKGEWNKEYNISGSEEFKVFELAKTIVRLTKSKSKIIVRSRKSAASAFQ